MKKLIVVILVMLTANVSTWAQDQMLQDTLQNVVVIKDARLDILVTRPEAIRLATEAASDEKPKIVENEIAVYNPIKAGKKDQYGLLRPLQTPSNYIEAQMSLQKLTDANIKATLTQTLDGPQLMVFEKDLKIAAAVLAQ